MGKNLKGKELGKGISQRKDGTYCGRYTDRFGKRRTIYSKKLPELRDELNKALYNDKILSNSVYENMTLDDWYDKWFNLFKKGTVKPSTLAEYDRTYQRHISPELGHMELMKITQLHVRQLLNQKLEYKISTQRKIRNLFKDILDKAMINELINRNPVKWTKVTQLTSEKREVKALTVDEQNIFFEWAKSSWYYHAFVVQLNSGLRTGELFALTADDIDFAKMQINVGKNLLYDKLEEDTKDTFHLGPPKTQTSIRTVPMTKQCKKALEAQIKRKCDLELKLPIKGELGMLLFTTKKNTPVNAANYNRSIKIIVDHINNSGEYKIRNFSGHWFRHTFATRCFEAGIQPKTVQQYLGHSNINITMDIYTHVFNNYEEEEIKKFENMLANIGDDFHG